MHDWNHQNSEREYAYQEDYLIVGGVVFYMSTEDAFDWADTLLDIISLPEIDDLNCNN